MESVEPQIIMGTLAEFFRDSVVEVMERQGLTTSDEAEFYLVNLLQSFATADRFHGVESAERDQPLALMLQQAIETTPDRAIPIYRRIGDTSLYVSGFFSRNLQHRSVSRGYYKDMGRNAYDALASLMASKRDRVFADVFAELAEGFPKFVEVLIEVSEAHSFGASQTVDDLIARWADAGSANAGSRLVSDGVLPLWRFETGDSID